MADRNDNHILVPDLPDAVKLGIDLHLMHAIAEPLIFDALREFFERSLILLLLGIQYEQLPDWDVACSRRPAYGRVGDPKVGRLGGIHIEPDVVLRHCLVPVVYRRPPVRLPAEEDAECRSALLTIHHPESWPLR